jgi:hypothetical protein
LLLHPELAEFMHHDGDRVREIEKAHRFKIDLIEDDSIALDEYKVINQDGDVDVTSLYQSGK